MDIINIFDNLKEKYKEYSNKFKEERKFILA